MFCKAFKAAYKYRVSKSRYSNVSIFSFDSAKVELRSAVEEVVKETPEYRCMQSQFSVLYNESLQLKAHLDEARTLLHGTRGTHQRQVELIEVIV